MSIAAAIFDGEPLAQAIGVPVYYGFVEAIAVSVYCTWAWKHGWTKAPTDITLWKAITTSYEVMAVDLEQSQSANGIQLPTTNKKSSETGWDYVDYGDAAKEPKSGFVDYEQANKEKEATTGESEPQKKGGWLGGLL